MTIGSLYHVALLLLLSVQSVVANYAALGLADGANEIDVQVAYKSTLTRLNPVKDSDSDALRQLIEAQKAYEALSDATMREEALTFVDYWSEVEYISSDDDLRRFAELQPGGSTRLRVIFVETRPDIKVYEAFAASTRLHGRVRVAQLCHRNMINMRGQLGKFYASLRVHENGVILIDPLSKASKITYERSGIGNDVERLLSGDSGMSKLARIQELDSRVYDARCRDSTSGQCSWSISVATEADFDEKRGEVSQLMKEFNDACKSLQVPEKYPQLACFWLRLSRAPEWRKALASSGAQFGDGKPVVFAWRQTPSGVLFAALGEALPERSTSMQLSTQEQARWSTFDGVAYYSIGICRFVERALAADPGSIGEFQAPVLPAPLRREDEPKESPTEKATRQYHEAVDCLSDQACILDTIEFGMFAAGVITPDSSESEKKTMMVGCGIALIMFLAFFWNRCCCCCGCSKRRPSKLDETQVLRNMQLLISVSLSRASKEAKYGLGIEPAPEGGLQVNDVNEGGLVGRWNATQPREAGKVRRGDRIVAVIVNDNGKQTVCTQTKAMQSAFANDNLVLQVAANRAENEVIKVASTLTIDEASLKKKGFSFASLDLTQDAELVEVPNSQAGMQVMKIGPKVEEWNQKARTDGTCCSQCIDVGDRVTISPDKHVLNCKFRFPEQVRTNSFEVIVQKSGPEDRLGMQIRASPCYPAQNEVLDVLDGAVQRCCSAPGGQPVWRGDRLVAANGKEGTAAMAAEFRAETVTLRFERWADQAGGSGPSNAPADATSAFGSAPAVGPPAMGPPAMLSAPGVGPPGKMNPPSATLAAAQPAIVQQPSFGGPAGGFGQPSFGGPAGGVGQPLVTPAPAAPAPMPSPSMSTPIAPPPALPSQPSKPAATAGESSGVVGKIIIFMLVAAVVAWIAVFGREPPPQWIGLPQPTDAMVKRIPQQTRMFLDLIHPSLYGDIGIILVFVGAVLMVHFLAYELSMLKRPQARKLLPQLCVASVASNFLGFGSFFLLVWAGVYV